MSDGPHKSLPMRRAWRRVAERGDKSAFAPEEVSRAVVLALEQDCRTDLGHGFLDELCRLFLHQEAWLFRNGLTAQLEQLRGVAGAGIGALILDHAIHCAERGETGLNGAARAIGAALNERAARGMRQVEEHYYRKSTERHALRVRARMEEGIGNAQAAIEGLAGRMVKLESGPSLREPRKRGLDDGVRR